MGVQSTRYVTRKRAEEIWVEKALENKRIILNQLVKVVSAEDIENFIEEEFDNYTIVPEGQED